jgi:TonB family protein
MDSGWAHAYHVQMRQPRVRLRLAALVAGLVLPLPACSPSSPAHAPVTDPTPAPVDTAPGEAKAPETAGAGNDALLAPSTSSNGASTSTAAPTEGPKDARSKEEIQRVVADNRQRVRACYDAALKDNPGIQGDLVVSFVINPEGEVKTAEVNWSESEIHIPELDTCAVEVVKTLKFPASSRGLESKVNYPFNFNPAPPDMRPKEPTPGPPSTNR